MKKKLPLFVFTMKNVMGKKLIIEGITQDSNKNDILKTKKYDCRKDCNGTVIMPAK